MNRIISGDAKYYERNKTSRLHREGSGMLESHGQHGGSGWGQRTVQGAGVCAEAGKAIKGSQRTRGRARGRKAPWKKEQDVQRCDLVLGFINSK